MTTTTQKADRVSINRAPKGGTVSPVNGRFYLGGQFMPLMRTLEAMKPAPLVGSSRQVAWANRLRAEGISRLEDELFARRLMLARRNTPDVAGVRQGIRRDAIALHNLMNTRSAASVIERRVELLA